MRDWNICLTDSEFVRSTDYEEDTTYSYVATELSKDHEEIFRLWFVLTIKKVWASKMFWTIVYMLHIHTSF